MEGVRKAGVPFPFLFGGPPGLSLGLQQLPGPSWAAAAALRLDLSPSADAGVCRLLRAGLGRADCSMRTALRWLALLCGVGHRALDMWVSRALLSPGCSGNGSVLGTNAAQRLAFVGVELCTLLAGVVAQSLEMIECPGPSLLGVQAWWHVRLWVRPPEGRLFQG